MRRLGQALLGALLLAIGFAIALGAPHPGVAAPNPKLASAVFAGGCFWCTESDFDKIPGVVSTTSGYSGGRLANPTYEQVSAGGTGHIEVVKVVYDPAKVSYQRLLVRFFRTVDPLDGGGQFCDRGSQYASAIFVANAAERRLAETTKGRAEEADRHPHPPRRPLLPGRGLPPGLLQEEPHQIQILPLALRPRRPPGEGLGRLGTAVAECLSSAGWTSCISRSPPRPQAHIFWERRHEGTRKKIRYLRLNAFFGSSPG
jgi:peptide-methionine (S)-S-oxide reductase